MSERGTIWYKRDPIRFLDGVEGMGPELIGAYAYLLDLIYARNGYSRRDDKALGGRMGCSTRKARALTDALVERGKIEIEGDFLTHKHAKNHAKLSRNLRETLAKHGRTGGEKSGKVRKNKALAEAYPSTKNEADKIRDRETTLEPTDVGSNFVSLPPTPQGGSEKTAKRRRSPSKAMPEGWVPDMEKAGRLKEDLGLTREEMNYCFQQMKGHAHATDRRLADWDQGFANWCRKAVQQREVGPDARNRRPTSKGTAFDF